MLIESVLQLALRSCRAFPLWRRLAAFVLPARTRALNYCFEADFLLSRRPVSAYSFFPVLLSVNPLSQSPCQQVLR